MPTTPTTKAPDGPLWFVIPPPLLVPPQSIGGVCCCLLSLPLTETSQLYGIITTMDFDDDYCCCAAMSLFVSMRRALLQPLSIHASTCHSRYFHGSDTSSQIWMQSDRLDVAAPPKRVTNLVNIKLYCQDIDHFRMLAVWCDRRYSTPVACVHRALFRMLVALRHRDRLSDPHHSLE
jgi:hypothetical protein